MTVKLLNLPKILRARKRAAYGDFSRNCSYNYMDAITAEVPGGKEFLWVERFKEKTESGTQVGLG